MSNFTPWQSGTALFTALSMTVSTVVPLMAPAPAFAQPTFSDVPSTYWAKDFITALAERNIIAGFPNGSFRPDAPVTRAQFATMLDKAFNQEKIRESVSFVDVPKNYWAADAIEEAYTTGFLTGYPGRVFRPNQNIRRAQVLVSLASGLNYSSGLPVASLLQYYRDGSEVPDYARTQVAAATEQGIVVNYPEVELLKPNKVATRAEVAAFLYQALVNTGAIAAVSSPYIVAVNNIPSRFAPVGTVRVPSGTKLPVKYDAADKILVAQNEPAPVPLALTVMRNVVSADGALLIPAGSQVVGELVIIEAEGGAQFFARELNLTNSQPVPIRATSQLITKTETISKGSGASNSRAIRNAAIGAAAAAAITVVTGGTITLGALLIGASAGAGTSLFGSFRNRDRVELISIAPKTDLTLTLNADLVLGSRQERTVEMLESWNVQKNFNP